MVKEITIGRKIMEKKTFKDSLKLKYETPNEKELYNTIGGSGINFWSFPSNLRKQRIG